MLKLVLFVVPLGLDTFAVSAALGTRGLTRRQALQISLVMSGFEMAMPLVGLAAGRGVHLLVGAAADYLAITVLALLGTWMLFHEERQEVGDAIGSGAPRGLAIVAIGLAISLDEFAIGFTIGLLHLSIWVAILLIGAQAFLFAQLGLRLGARLNQAFRERAEQFAGVTLFALAALLIVEKL